MRTSCVARGRDVLPLATLFLLSLGLALPLWGPGLLNTRGGGDSPFLILRTHQLAVDLRAGHFPARWMPDAAYGLGYPFFSYYAALPYYVAAALHLAGLDLLAAVKMSQTIFSIAAGLAMYGWTRKLFDKPRTAWLASVAYLCAPFHLVNLYVRGDSLSEFAAFAWYPLILWGIDRLAERPSRSRIALAAAAFAGLILTHNVSALIFSPFALAYLAVRALVVRRRRLRVLGLGLAAWMLGLAVAASFWVPALFEADQVQLGAQTTGYFFFGNHFRGADLVQPSFFFDYGMGEGRTPFAMGLVQAALAAAATLAIAFSWRRRVDWRGAAVLAGLMASTLMITPLSRPLWDHLPLLPLVQFPWRFLSVQSLFAAAAIGWGLGAGAMGRPRMSRGLAVVLGLILVTPSLGRLRPDYLAIASDEITAARLQLYELFTGNVGSTIRYEYLPRTAVPRPWTGPSLFDPRAAPLPRTLEGEAAEGRETVHEPTLRVWEVAVGEGGARLAFPLHWWPGWQATVDGQPVPVEPAPDSGWISLSVPSGLHTVVLRLGRTPLRAAAEGTSVVALIVLCALGAKGWRRPRVQAFPLALAAGGICLLGILPFVAPQYTPARDEDLTMDFEQMPFLHHNPGGVDFGAVRLLGYRYEADRLRAGDVLRVSMDWAGQTEGLTATLRLVAPAAHLRGVEATWSEVSVPLAPSTNVELPVPERTSPGLMLTAVEVRGSTGDLRPRSPAGRTLGATYLRPVWVEPVQSPPPDVAATWAGGAVRLHNLQAAQIGPDRLEVRLDWSAARPPSGNWALSLRLTDPAGNEWARVDAQPGYGFLPTGLWPAGRLIPDRYVLPLPAGTPPGQRYTLRVALYRASNWEELGAITATVPLTRATFRPEAPVLASLSDGIALSRLDVPDRIRQGETLRWTAWWSVRGRPGAVQAEWSLDGPETFSATLPLAPGSDPTGWPKGAWVAGRSALVIPPDASPGDYRLSVALIAEDGHRLGAYTHERPIRVLGRERTFTAPPMARQVGATFGGMIELLGYDLEREGAALRLTLHWRALSNPDRHYVFFVHVADPATARPVAQVDSMPRQFAYPTGMWIAGEVVSDQVEISLEGVPPGSYDLAVGWYDPETGERLAAHDAGGQPLIDGRVVLPDRIEIP